MTFSYQWPLVAFSVLIAILASYTSLRLAFRLAWASRASRPWWLAGGACAMGIGIWSMHFVGMLAVQLPVAVAYDPLLTVVSVLPAILASAIALSMLGRSGSDAGARLLASLLMGLGIVAMHYTGMDAMRMSPPIAYDHGLFALSVLIAVGASWAALHLVFLERSESGMSFAPRLAGAVVMGLAIAGMHYTGMAAARFAPDAVCTVTAGGLEGDAIGLFVGLLAVLVLGASLALTFFDEMAGENSLYRALLAAQSDAGEGVLVIAGGRVVYANAAMQRLSGYDEAQLKALPAWSALVRGPVPALPLLQPAVPVRGQPGGGRHELDLRTADGGLRHCEVVLTAFRHAEAARHLLVCIDISERKAAEAALRQSEAHLKDAQRLARIGSWHYEIGRRDYLMSEEALRIHEFTSADGRVPGVMVSALVHPEDREVVRRRREEALRRGATFSVQLRLVLPGGRIKHVRLLGAAQTDAAGEAVSMSGTIQDISEQVQAELALRLLNETLEQRVLDRTRELDQQRAFIETILDTAETLIFVIDAWGRFVRFNRACERLTGYSFETLRGQPIWETVVPPERRQDVQRRHAHVVSPEELPTHLEVEWLTRDGQRRLIAWSNATLTDAAGRMEYMIGTGIDITERKRAEQALIVANRDLSSSLEHLRQTQSQLVQAEKMAALGSLVAGISHEINTPLGIGVTSATALQEELHSLRRAFDAGTMKRSTLERYLAHGQEGSDILVRNLMRAAELIRSFKQVAVDQVSDERRIFDLGEYIDEVVLSLQPRFKGHRVQVLNRSQAGLRVDSHPGAIYQILSNLLLNALLHGYDADEQGTIIIAAQRLGDEVQIECIDDGKGIAPEIRDRIFEPFFTTRRGAGGSGLGLHIVFNLVVSTLNGSIQLVPGAGRGTTFRINFPLSLEQQHEHA